MRYYEVEGVAGRRLRDIASGILGDEFEYGNDGMAAIALQEAGYTIRERIPGVTDDIKFDSIDEDEEG